MAVGLHSTQPPGFGPQALTLHHPSKSATSLSIFTQTLYPQVPLFASSQCPTTRHNLTTLVAKSPPSTLTRWISRVTTLQTRMANIVTASLLCKRSMSGLSLGICESVTLLKDLYNVLITGSRQLRPHSRARPHCQGRQRAVQSSQAPFERVLCLFWDNPRCISRGKFSPFSAKSPKHVRFSADCFNRKPSTPSLISRVMTPRTSRG